MILYHYILHDVAVTTVTPVPGYITNAHSKYFICLFKTYANQVLMWLSDVVVCEKLSQSFLNTVFAQVILTGDVTGNSGSRIFLSTNSGNSFNHVDLPFHPMVQIMYNPHEPKVLVVISNKVGVYPHLSK